MLARARSMQWQDVCPSVCHTYLVDTAKRIIEIIGLGMDTPFLIFHTKRYDNIPTGTPSLTGASNAGGMKKIAIFDQSLYLESDTYLQQQTIVSRI